MKFSGRGKVGISGKKEDHKGYILLNVYKWSWNIRIKFGILVDQIYGVWYFFLEVHLN